MVIPQHTSVPWSQQGLAILIPKEDDHPPISRGYTNVYYTIPSRRNPIHDSGMTMPFFLILFWPWHIHEIINYNQLYLYDILTNDGWLLGDIPPDLSHSNSSAVAPGSWTVLMDGHRAYNDGSRGEKSQDTFISEGHIHAFL